MGSLELKKGEKTRGTNLKIELNPAGTCAYIHVYGSDSMKGLSYAYIAKQLDSIIEWHFANGQTLERIMIVHTRECDPFVATWIGIWLATADVPKKIRIMQRENTYGTECELRAATRDLIWEDPRFLVSFKQIQDPTLVVELQTDLGVTNLGGVPHDGSWYWLGAMLQRVSLLANKWGTFNVQILTRGHIGIVQEAALKAAVQQCTWPEHVGSVTHATRANSSNTKPLKMTA